MNSNKPDAAGVRSYLLQRYAQEIRGAGRVASELPDTFDFLMEGIVDSFGVLELIAGIEKEFGLELDMSGIDSEQMTLLGPLSDYVAKQANGGGSVTGT